MNYTNNLKAEGMADSRVNETYQALDKLHQAISKLDTQNRLIFDSINIRQRLNDFAVADGVRWLY